MSDFVLVLVSAALVNHLVLHTGPLPRPRLHALGLCSALTMLLALPAAALLPHVEGLELWFALPLLAILAWGLPRVLARVRPDWPVHGLAPLLLGNGAVLGLFLQLSSTASSLGVALAWGLCAGLGFWLALALFDDLRQRSDHPDLPPALRGLPIELIGAGLMAMAFSGFNGLFTQ
ncbi:Rnf-Nqr domain containing protein [Pseudomonas entomophila]|uniref:Rnf-Nqr domain containing protein n=1 Tax=Pseudomonas entomophila TaxID=312306 RepID=UPI0023D7F7D0|nr:Rnf-Nqr domain containing protein [Pseudomonas entomophila]MDF0731199.1 Rnf-Nqr domain containing protein [Pseudomonas entomophila]